MKLAPWTLALTALVAGTLTLELALYWRGCATGAFVAALPAKGACIAQPVVTTGRHSHRGNVHAR